MDEELRKQIMDYFDAWDLVEFLQLSTEDIVNAFPDEILENIEDIEELMTIGIRHG